MNSLSEDLVLTNEIETSKTYHDTGTKIEGFINGTEAMEKAIEKRLCTEQYDCPIYSFSYGIETEDLIGNDRAYAIAELKRRITETLLEDDRITGVSGFSATFDGDSAVLSFTVSTVFGNINTQKGVNI